MNARETQAALHVGTRSARVSTAGRLTRARAWLRLVAYLVDWLVMVIIASLLVSIGGLQLYLASDRGTQDPPDGSVYTFLVISLLALPVWMIVTLAGWIASGRSIGKLATALRIVDRRGRQPGVLRSLVRLVIYMVEHVSLVIAPAVIVLDLLTDDALPVWLVPGAVLLLAGALAALLPAVLRPGGHALHDLAAGTTVVEE